MNKDMINIDDFVREKLGGHTEKEDPAAWLRMKDLLDKEMPEKAAPFIFRLGKPMAFLGAALLIGALCVGGYKLNALREKEASGIVSGTNPTSKQPNSSNYNNTTLAAPVNTPSLTETNLTENNTNPVTNENITKNSSSAPDAQALSDNTSNPTTAQNNSIDPSHQHLASAHTNGRIANNSLPNPSLHKANNRSVDKELTKETNKINNNNGSSVAQNNKKNNAVHSTTHTVLASNTGTIHKKSSAKQFSKTTTKASVSDNKNNSSSTAKTNKSNADNTTGSAEDAQKDSMSAITVITKQSSAKGFPKRKIMIKDTVNISKFEIPSNTAGQAAPINTTISSTTQPSKKDVKLAANQSKKANKLNSKRTAAKQENILASKKADTKEQNQKVTALTASKAEISKAKTGKSTLSKWVEGMNLPEAIASAKEDARNAKFYAGFSAGANYTPSGNGNNFQGVQFGPTGELVFNKHWSLFGAVNYFNRSGKKVVYDNFAKEVSNNIVDSMVGANSYFTVLTDSTNRYFNFSSVHSFEMPISVRYAINKFYLMTGINLAYSLPVNVELVEKEYKGINSRPVSTNTTSQPILKSSRSELSTGDFGSRFGIGYVVGAGYQITPAWQTDLRMVNTFWDNSKGAGAKRLSKDFYRLPSIQITVGYQFNRGRSKATFGPNSIR